MRLLDTYKFTIMKYSVLFTDGNTKPFETENEMRKFMVQTKYKNIILSGKSKYVRLLKWNNK